MGEKAKTKQDCTSVNLLTLFIWHILSGPAIRLFSTCPPHDQKLKKDAALVFDADFPLDKDM